MRTIGGFKEEPAARDYAVIASAEKVPFLVADSRNRNSSVVSKYPIEHIRRAAPVLNLGRIPRNMEVTTIDHDQSKRRIKPTHGADSEQLQIFR